MLLRGLERVLLRKLRLRLLLLLHLLLLSDLSRDVLPSGEG